MKKFLLIFLIASLVYAQGTQWSSYPRVTSLASGDVLLMSRSLSMKGFLYSSLLSSSRTVFDTAYFRLNYANTSSKNNIFTGINLFREGTLFGTNGYPGSIILSAGQPSSAGTLTLTTNAQSDRAILLPDGKDEDTVAYRIWTEDSSHVWTNRNNFTGAFKLTGRDTAKTDYVYSKNGHLWWRKNDTTAVSLDSVVVGVQGDTVRFAINIMGGGAKRIPYQFSADSTLFITAPSGTGIKSLVYDSTLAIFKWVTYSTADSVIFATKYFTGQTYKLKSDSTAMTGFVTQYDNLSKLNKADSTGWGYATKYNLLSKLNKSDSTAITGYATQYDLTAKQNTLTTGNLTESITGLQFDQTRQVIGGAAALSLTAGYFIPTTTEQSTWNAKGTVTSIATTAPISGGTITTTGTISIADAVADGSTKGAASFTANDFNNSSGNISLDYANGQAATTSQHGFLTDTDWNTFNGKQAALNGTGFVKASGTSISYDNSTYTTLAAVVAANNNFTGTNTFENGAVGFGKINTSPAVLTLYAGAAAAYPITINTATLAAPITVTMPTSSGTLLLTNGSGASLTGTASSLTAGAVTNGVYTNAENTFTNNNYFNGSTKKTYFGSGHYLQLPGYNDGATAGMINFDAMGNYIEYIGNSAGEFIVASRAYVTGLGYLTAVPANYAGGSSIATVGSITTGEWHGTSIADAHIASASTWNSQTTLAAVVAANNTWTGTNTFNDRLSFGAVGYFVTPILGGTNGGQLWYSVGDLKYRDAVAGVDRTLISTSAQIITALGFTPMSNPMTALGNIIYGSGTGTPAKLTGNITTTKKFLTQTGDGFDSAAPVWTDLFGTANTWGSTQTMNITGNASGTSGSTTGNAATVTNGVYTNAANTFAEDQTLSKALILTGAHTILANNPSYSHAVAGLSHVTLTSAVGDYTLTWSDTPATGQLLFIWNNASATVTVCGVALANGKKMIAIYNGSTWETLVGA
jgi:hypothetical protein